MDKERAWEFYKKGKYNYQCRQFMYNIEEIVLLSPFVAYASAVILGFI